KDIASQNRCVLHRRTRNTADRNLLAVRTEQLFEFRHTGFACDNKDIRFAHRDSEITKLSHVILNGRVAKQLLQNDRSRNVADHRSTLGRRIEYVVGGDDASRPCHVVDDHVRIAGDKSGNMPADQPRILIVAAARGETYDHPYRLTPVEVRQRFLIVAWLLRLSCQTYGDEAQ